MTGPQTTAPKSVLPLLLDPTPQHPVPFGTFRLLRRIGAGGMGEVFLAREAGPHSRVVVVKKVLPHLLANPAFVGRFLDEAKVVARLNHPNIARVFGMGEVGSELFLAMEYVQGKTISRFARRLRERHEEMPLGIALFLVEKVCEGLQHAHDATDAHGAPLHLVHRDLSPANVCVSYAGDVKIIDFGASQSTLKEEQTAPRVVIGNLTYMAPEQARKLPIDGRADVYSSGVILWELLAWRALPQKGDPIERWRKAASPAWDPPSMHQPTLPKDLDEIVLRALERDPDKRYANAATFAAMLRRARLRHAPAVSERDVGELLARAFAAEKASEDELLEEAWTGTSRGAEREGVVVSPPLAPPTALAFEHTVVLGSADFVEGPVIDSGAQQTEAMGLERTQPVSEATRSSFGVTYPEHPKVGALVRAIEGGDDAVEGRTRPPGEPGGLRQAALYSSIFLAAMGLGFAAVWLVMSG